VPVYLTLAKVRLKDILVTFQYALAADQIFVMRKQVLFLGQKKSRLVNG